MGSWGTSTLRGEGTFTSRYYLREFNLPTDAQESYWMVNGYLSYTAPKGDLSVRAFVKNATNEPVIGGFLGIVGYKGASFGMPRTFGMEISYDFK
jgi:iron complex outermembrane recepter protein